MLKVGIFVEGQTERIFVEKLLNEYLTSSYVTIEAIKHLGNKVSIVRKRNTHSGTRYYFLIHDVSGDGRVVSALLERAPGMITRQNYKRLLALRDLHPRKRGEKNKVLNSINSEFNRHSFGDKLRIILAVMEIEAWFLADYNLFSRINEKLTPDFIKNKLNVDLLRGNPELYNRPATIVDKIFRISGEKYKKREKQSYKICYKIDYEFLCCTEEVHQKVSSFKYFLNCIDESLSNN